MFAEAVPATNWMLNLQWLLSMLALVVALWSNLSNRPKKREVTMTEEFVRKSEFDQLREDFEAMEETLDDLRDQASQDKGEILAAGEDRAGRIHGRIDQVEREIRDLPSQVIALLKNTSSLRDR